MRPNEFRKLREGLRLNAAPADERERAEVARRLETALAATGLFHTVEADVTDDGDQLVIAMAEFAPEVSATDAAAALERAWLDTVSYRFWEAHSVLVDDGHAELRGASRSSQLGHFVTVHVVLQEALPRAGAAAVFIPSQAHRPDGSDPVGARPAGHRRKGLLTRLAGR